MVRFPSFCAWTRGAREHKGAGQEARVSSEAPVPRGLWGAEPVEGEGVGLGDTWPVEGEGGGAAPR